VDYASFLHNEPSSLYFETLSDIETLVLKKIDLEHLYETSHYWANFGRLISEKVYYFTHHRSLSQLTLPAKERYHRFIKENPALLSKIPQHHIAAYLGITPQSLSRLKKY
jgi:CRP-like cAMP-binding protein